MWLVLIRMCFKSKMRTRFWRLSTKKWVSSIPLQFLCNQLHGEMIFWIYWVKKDILLKLISSVTFYFGKIWLLENWKLQLWLLFVFLLDNADKEGGFQTQYPQGPSQSRKWAKRVGWSPGEPRSPCPIKATAASQLQLVIAMQGWGTVARVLRFMKRI